jgi:hypothetical protein
VAASRHSFAYGQAEASENCSSRAHSHQPSQLHRLQSDAAAGRVSEFHVSKPDASVPHRENVGEETNQSRSWRNVAEVRSETDRPDIP